MKIREILHKTAHRPWKIPLAKWKFYQEWNRAIFLHWPVDKTELRKHVPEEIEIDLIDGKPWISVVAFTMEKIRPRNLPSFFPISNFDEINIRTYVKYNGKAGVYFLNIQGAKKISCQIARSLSELPYRYSVMKRQANSFVATDEENNDVFELKYKIGTELTQKSELDKWLTERYSLVQDTVSFINQFEIHHLEWPTSKIELNELKVEYSKFKELIKGSPQLCHYSTGVQVIAWDKKKYRKLATSKSES